MGFDLKLVDTSEKSAEGVEVELLHPETGEPTGAFWTTVGADSDKYADAMDRASEAQAKEQKESGRKFSIFSDTRKSNLRVVLDCSTGFRGLEEDGKETKFNRANAKRILKAHKWIVDQVGRAIHDRSLFLPGVDR